MTMTRYIKSIVGLLAAGALFASCEDVIDPSLRKADPVLVVDAWINNKVEDQVIRLSLSQPYLSDALPPGVSGATVTVSYDGGSIDFTEDPDNAGVYKWATDDATTEEVFGEMGRAYTLTIVVNGQTFQAASKIKRTVAIDSVTFEKDDSPFYPENSYIGQFWAKEPLGTGDTYWIRTYKNGTLLSKPSEINIAYDAGFSPGGSFDGITFIPPIRDINPTDVDEDDQPLSPYEVGDSVYVEVHSITYESFTFLSQVIVQTDRPGGFGELFSTPLANVSTNINSPTPGPLKAVGFFNVSAVEGLGKKLEQEP
jgi:Domain of unknown function (DUF4249)